MQGTYANCIHAGLVDEMLRCHFPIRLTPQHSVVADALQILAGVKHENHRQAYPLITLYLAQVDGDMHGAIAVKTLQP
jgi:hypothetical protein